jgi:hypothetical protein
MIIEPVQTATSSSGRLLGSQNATGPIRYPTPYFDVANTYMPATVRDLFQWCRFYFLVNPLVAAVVSKMAEYPLTDLILDGDTETNRRWETFFEDDLALRETMIDIGLFYHAYGNAILSMVDPFVKMLKCEQCGFEVRAEKASYRWRGYRFQLKCGACKHEGRAAVRDEYLKTTRGSRLLLWNPEDLTTLHNDLTGETSYHYRIPAHLRNAVKLGKREIVERIPQEFVDAVRLNKDVVLDPSNVYHMRRPSILTGQLNRGWGIPLIMPVLRHLFFYHLMLKTQECVLLERMLPFNIVSPTTTVPGMNPYEHVNLSNWKDMVVEEVQRWRKDPHYVSVMPIPLNHQVIGGDGRALLLTQDIRQLADTIVLGMGCVPELLWGGVSWSGSNVSLRMMENGFLRYVSNLLRMVRLFVIKRTAARLDWLEPKSARFKPFKMADDLQQQAFRFQLNQSKLISDASFRQGCDYDPREEDRLIRAETKQRYDAVKEQQTAEAEVAGEIGVIQARWQAKAQNAAALEAQQMQQGSYGTAPGEPGEGAPSTPVNPETGLARLRALPAAQQLQVLQRISGANPDAAQRLQQALQGAGAGGSALAALPEQLPPRRSAPSV